MKKILFLVLLGFALFACKETEMMVKDETLKPALEATSQDGTGGFPPNTIVIHSHWQKDTLIIDFLAKKVLAKPVLGAAINLKYNAQAIEYVSYDAGDFLEQGGAPTGNQKPTYLIAPAELSEAGKKELIVGATLFRGTQGVTGSGRLVTLRFKSNKPAAFEIEITKGMLGDLQANPIPGINWPKTISVFAPK